MSGSTSQCAQKRKNCFSEVCARNYEAQLEKNRTNTTELGMNRRPSSDAVTLLAIRQLSQMISEIFCTKTCKIHSLLLIYQETTKQKEYEIVRYCRIEAVVIYTIKIFEPEDELLVCSSLVSNKERFYFSLVGGTRAALCILSTLCCRRNPGERK